MDVRYALSGPWTGGDVGLHTASITLVHPRLNGRYANGVLSFGALDGVIKALAQLPRTTEPLPDIVVVNGEARLSTVGGAVRLRAAGSLRAGALTMLQGQVEPLHLRFGGESADSDGGAFGVESFAGSLRLSVDQRAIALRNSAGSIKIARLTVSAETPYPDGKAAWTGPASAGFEAAGVAGRIGATAFDRASLGATFSGTMDATRARQALHGSANMRVQADSISGRGVAAGLTTITVTLPNFDLEHGAGGSRGAAAAKVDVSFAQVTAPGVRLTSVSSQMRSEHIGIQAGKGAPVVSGVILGNLAGSGAASGPSGGEPYLSAVRRGLADFRFSTTAWEAEISGGPESVALLAPLKVAAKSGASVVVSAQARSKSASPASARGSAAVTIRGGGLPALELAATNAVIARTGSSADIALQWAADAGPAKGAKFRIAGRGAWRGREARFSLAGCAPLSIDRLTVASDTITKVSGKLCAAAAPLLVANPAGWRLSGRIDGVAAADMDRLVTVRGVGGSVSAAGSAKTLEMASLTLEKGEVLDAATPRRFEPLSGLGHLDVAAGRATGRLAISLAKGPPLATLSVRHVLATGAGRVDIESNLQFTRAGLQPAGISRLVSAVRNASGVAKFAGWFSWARSGALKSGGEVSADAFDFTSPLGAVVGLNADLRFTSLMPLLTPPNQTVTIRQVRAFLPVSALAAQFDLGEGDLNLNAASGAVASGHVRLEPMRLALAPGAKNQGAILLDRISLGEILAATSLSDAVKTNAVVEGRIPFEIGPKGLTIERGELASVKAGRISISRAALTGASGGAAAKPPGFAEDLAYQAMENLAFDNLSASLNSRANDRLAMLFHIKGRHDPPTRQKATVAVKDILSGHALDKPLTLPSGTKIDLTLDTSLNFGDLVKAVAQAWRETLAPSVAPGHSGAVQSSTVKHPSR